MSDDTVPKMPKTELERAWDTGCIFGLMFGAFAAGVLIALAVVVIKVLS